MQAIQRQSEVTLETVWIQLSPLQVKTGQAGDMTVNKVLSSLKRHGLQHKLKSDITGSRLSIPLQLRPTNRTCATDAVEFVAPELDSTRIKDNVSHTHDEIRRSMAHSRDSRAAKHQNRSVFEASMKLCTGVDTPKGSWKKIPPTYSRPLVAAILKFNLAPILDLFSAITPKLRQVKHSVCC